MASIQHRDRFGRDEYADVKSLTQVFAPLVYALPVETDELRPQADRPASILLRPEAASIPLSINICFDIC